MPLRVGITLGDPAGIGPEIVRAAINSGRLPQGVEYQCIGESAGSVPGKPTPESARAALVALDQAVQLVRTGKINAIVTGPIHKARMAEFDGPISPDTLFFHLVRGHWDAALCMYHDQGLIPLKLHGFDVGVNVTLGLPFPRTSPDHGTAFDIAGKNRARPDSMIAAINLAVELGGK